MKTQDRQERVAGVLEKTFHGIIDAAYDIIEIWDADYTLLYISEACYRVIGMRPDQLEGKKFRDLVNVAGFWSPSLVPYIYENKKACMQREVSILGVPYRSIGVPILDEKGEVEYIIITSRDEYESLAAKLLPVMADGKELDVPDDGDLRYVSFAMREVVRMAKKVAASDAPCLLLGETGTGKSLLAKQIHQHSLRKDKQFHVINMASMNPNLIESELFGYTKGSFTGASKEGKEGLFVKADGGTLLLDEIGELPLDLQAKFLHVLQEGVVTPVGGTDPIPVDVRILAATNKDLVKLVGEGKFREDLYYRLNIFELVLPPLRDRGPDLDLLISHFLYIFTTKYKRNCAFTPEAMKLLQEYSWPGNIRELSNVMERCVVMSDGEHIEEGDVPEHLRHSRKRNGHHGGIANIRDMAAAVEEYEGDIIRYHYQQQGSSRKLAAALGLSPTTARRLIDKYVKEKE